ncbi:uncharacterized protein SAPINGB_P004864 [Magnusiomyces paraingens]|uniref:Maf-like protein n=1 Tax=Magnusiomyces paraingens TaxID=2606893 RepID=A0A5E8BXF3_9ASCO|nr:uncharacterized protein SAPINGB_P004864 [Saprochaete ingens]VVT56153.1 unnamed protein product [Saprochaete ingens]
MNNIHNQLSQGRIVLASGSPRRKQILEEQLGFKNISVVPSKFKEDLSKDTRSPFQYVMDTATEKALDVYRSEIESEREPSIVLAADTVVVSVEQILEKPKSPYHHLEMLKHLRDSPFPHKVFTAVVAIVPLEVPITPGYALETYIEESIVNFDKTISNEFLQSYVDSGEATDAAGGYKIQGRGALLIKSIEGDFFNVMGLPANGTHKLIERVIKIADNENAGGAGSGDEDEDEDEEEEDGRRLL